MHDSQPGFPILGLSRLEGMRRTGAKEARAWLEIGKSTSLERGESAVGILWGEG